MLKIDEMAIQTTTLEVSFSAPWPPIPLVLVASERAQCRLARGPLTPNLQPPRKVAFQRSSATLIENLFVESKVKVALRARCARAPEVARPAWGSRAATAGLIMILGGQKMPSARPNDRHGPQTGRFGLPIVFQQLGGQSRLSQSQSWIRRLLLLLNEASRSTKRFLTSTREAGQHRLRVHLGLQAINRGFYHSMGRLS